MNFIIGTIILVIIASAYVYGRFSPSNKIRRYLEDNDIEGFKKYLSTGIDISKPLRSGAKPVVYAAYLNNYEMVCICIEYNADIVDGLALHAGAMNGNINILELLIDNGADINGIDETHFSKTALLVAAEFNQKEAVEWLLEHGADPLIADSEGNDLEFYTKLQKS